MSEDFTDRELDRIREIKQRADDRLDALEIKRILEEARVARVHAKKVRLNRLGCRMWVTALTLAALCWIAAAFLGSGAFGATGAVLLIPAVVGGFIHANYFAAEDEAS